MKKALILSTILLLSHQNTFTAEAAQANPNDAQFELLASFTNGSSYFDLSPDGTTIATARLGALAVFNTTTREVQNLNIPAPDGSNKGFLGVSFANSGSFVGSTYYPEVWDPKTGKCWVVYTEKESSQYARLSPNGDQLLTIGRTPPEVPNIPVILTARIWDTQTKKPLCVLSADVRLRLLGPDDNFWSDNGKLVALPLEDTIGVWESNNPKALHMLRPTGLVTATAFSPDQTMLVSASFNNAINVWCLKRGNCLNVLEGHTQRCRNIFTGIGQVITPSPDGTVRVWDPQTGQCLKVLEGHKGGILTSAFCPKTGILATGSQDKTVRIWDVNTEELLQIVPCSSCVDKVAFNEDGTILAIGSGKLNTAVMTIQVFTLLQPKDTYFELLDSILDKSQPYSERSKKELSDLRKKEQDKKVTIKRLWQLFGTQINSPEFDIDKAQLLLRQLEYLGVVIPEEVNRLMLQNTPDDKLFPLKE